MENENAPAAALQDVVVHHFDAEQVGNDLGRAVVVPADPDDFQMVGELTEERKDFPVCLDQPPEVERIEQIAVEDQPAGANVAVHESFEE